MIGDKESIKPHRQSALPSQKNPKINLNPETQPQEKGQDNHTNISLMKSMA